MWELFDIIKGCLCARKTVKAFSLWNKRHFEN